MPRTPPELFAAKPKRTVAYEFVLDALASGAPVTRAMLGATAVYLDERVVFILREKGDQDDGVWVAFEPAREAEVASALPNLVPISLFGKIRGWKSLAARQPDFEDDVLHACKLALAPASILGKQPTRQKKRASSGSAPARPKRGDKPASKRGK
jgi:hypothetical protein